MANKTFEELKATGALPSPPGVGMEILRITQSENCSVDELAKCIQSDPSLTGRLLQVANSALAGGTRPCATIKEATMRLGLRSVRSIALGFSLVSAHRNGVCEAFDYGVFWSQSLARAVAAHVMSARFKIGVPAEVFVAALVSDLGSLALATVHPRDFAEILSSPESVTANGRAVLEQQRFGIDHREVTAAMLTEWRLPDGFSTAAQAVALAAPPLQEGKRGPGVSALVWISARFAAAFILPDDKPLDVELVQGALAAFPDWNKDDLPFLWNEMVEAWRKWGNMLEIVTTAVPPYNGGPPTKARQRSPFFAERPVGKPAPAAPAPATKSPAPATAAATAKPTAAHAPAAKPVATPAPATKPGSPPAVPAAAPTAVPAAAKPPAATPGAPPTTAAPAPALASGGTVTASRARILLVDDDTGSLKLLGTLLQRAGHHVTMMSDGKEALKAAMQLIPHIVIADRNMPGMDGVALCKSLRAFEAGRRVYLLLLTSDENEDRIVEAFDAGCDDYVVKPFKPKLLLARVRAGMRVVRLQERVDSDKATMQKQVAELGILARRLTQAAVTDVLTELPNRRFAMEALREGWEKSAKEDGAFSAIMVDIDKFKRVNDTYGHDIGDLVLKETSKVLSTATEPPATVCRLGGEEFVVVMPGVDAERAIAFAEKLRAAIEAHPIRGGSFDGHVTASLGVATRGAGIPDFEALLKLADEGLYVAKEHGRNQVRCVQLEGRPVEPLAPAPASA
ncbi:MAG: diguanylate cyclase [Planctomycetes bacterium]|nr:diguanylate cyclase [Planctomycetota bacterium]